MLSMDTNTVPSLLLPLLLRSVSRNRSLVRHSFTILEMMWISKNLVFWFYYVGNDIMQQILFFCLPYHWYKISWNISWKKIQMLTIFQLSEFDSAVLVHRWPISWFKKIHHLVIICLLSTFSSNFLIYTLFSLTIHILLILVRSDFITFGLWDWYCDISSF